MKINYPDGPRSDMGLSDAEKALRVRRFRKRAVFADVCAVLPVVSALTLLLLYRASVRVPLALVFGLAGVLLLSLLAELVSVSMAFRRCPFCGRLFLRWDWKMAPFKWRWGGCPDCDFTPYWDREQGGKE